MFSAHQFISSNWHQIFSIKSNHFNWPCGTFQYYCTVPFEIDGRKLQKAFPGSEFHSTTLLAWLSKWFCPFIHAYNTELMWCTYGLQRIYIVHVSVYGHGQAWANSTGNISFSFIMVHINSIHWNNALCSTLVFRIWIALASSHGSHTHTYARTHNIKEQPLAVI